MSEDARDNPGVVAPPPLIFAGALAAGLLLNRLVPTAPLPKAPRRVLGTTLTLAGGATVVSGFRELRHGGTNVSPSSPSTAIVTGGPYRFTRNPLYVGMTAMYAGLSALADAPPPLALLPAVLAIVRRGVIEREERYLQRKFGDEYLRYKSRVRRWI